MKSTASYAEAVLRANHLVMIDLQPCCKGTVEQGARLVGNVAIGEGSVIDTGSVIRGPVIVSSLGKTAELVPPIWVPTHQ